MANPKWLCIAALTGLGLSAGGALAADCPTTVKDKTAIDDAGIVALYECLKDAMAEAYASGDNAVGKEYRSWTVTGTRPGFAGTHSDRFLLTWANPVAAEQYMKYASDGADMPVGSILAKESFDVSVKKGQAVIGPLFIMTKVGTDKAPETDGWLYEAVQPNGKMMKFPQAMCHDCHVAWEAQDELAYPLEEVRISAPN